MPEEGLTFFWTLLEYIVYRCHRSLAMKLINLRAHKIERVGHVGCMLARSRAIARASLNGLQSL